MKRDCPFVALGITAFCVLVLVLPTTKAFCQQPNSIKLNEAQEKKLIETLDKFGKIFEKLTKAAELSAKAKSREGTPDAKASEDRANELLNEGRAAIAKKEYARAAEHFQKAVDIGGGKEAHNELAYVLAASPDPAVRNPKLAVRNAASLMLSKNPQFCNTSAIAMASAGKFDTAIDDLYDCVLAIDESKTLPKARKASLLQDAGNKIEMFESKVPYTLDHPSAWFVEKLPHYVKWPRGSALSHSGDDRLLSVHWPKTKAFLAQDEFYEAERELHVGLLLYPTGLGSEIAHAQRGFIFFKFSEFQEAEKEFSIAIPKWPSRTRDAKYADILASRGYARWKLGREWLSDFETAAAIDPKYDAVVRRATEPKIDKEDIMAAVAFVAAGVFLVAALGNSDGTPARNSERPPTPRSSLPKMVKRLSSCSNCGGDGRSGFLNENRCTRCGGSCVHSEWVPE